MSALVYFSSASGNTARFVEGCRLDEFGIHAMRIPLRPDEPELHVNEPYVLLTPTYGGGTIGKAVPVQVKRFLNDERNRSGIIGVIASGTPTSAKPTASQATSSRPNAMCPCSTGSN